jgi:Ca2+-binding RTX toxin-like protein
MPAGALASDVSVFTHRDNSEECRDIGACDILHYVSYQAGKGEASVVALTQEPGGVLRFRDDGAPLKAGTGCKAVDPNEATCKVTKGLESVHLDLGDGADTSTVVDATTGISVTGGTGDDTITGGPGDDNLLGSEGADTITAGAGDDILDGGKNTKTQLFADVLDGGEGTDSTGYDRKKAVTVNLGDPAVPAGEAGEGDTVRSIENVEGGDGNDVLTGSAAKNRIDGSLGNDLIDGMGGSDFIRGSNGRDKLYGSGGGDVIEGEDGRDRLVGGCGRDSLDGGFGADRIFARDGTRDYVSGGALGAKEGDFAAVDAGLDKTDTIDHLRKLPPPQTPC